MSLERWLSTRRRGVQGYWVYGPQGCGKSTLIQTACARCNCEVVEINSMNASIQLLKNWTQNTFLGSKKRSCVVIDDVGEVVTKARGMDSFLADLLNPKKQPNPKRPVVITSIEKPWGKLDKIKKHCVLSQVHRLRASDVEGRLKSSNLPLHLVPKWALDEILVNSNGDVEYAKRQLEFYLTQNEAAERKPEGDSFISKKSSENEDNFKVFSRSLSKRNRDGSKMSHSDQLSTYYQDTFMLPQFLHHNYPAALPTGREIQTAAAVSELISMGDVVANKARKTMDFSLSTSQAHLSFVHPLSLLDTRQTQRLPRSVMPRFPMFPACLGKSSKAKATRARFNNLHVKVYANGRPFDPGDADANIKLHVSKLIATVGTDFDLAFAEVVAFFKDNDEWKFWANYWSETRAAWKKVPTKTKSRLTREWRKEGGFHEKGGKVKKTAKKKDPNDFFKQTGSGTKKGGGDLQKKRRRDETEKKKKKTEKKSHGTLHSFFGKKSKKAPPVKQVGGKQQPARKRKRSGEGEALARLEPASSTEKQPKKKKRKVWRKRRKKDLTSLV